jgi:phenylacetic acid degradation protein
MAQIYSIDGVVPVVHPSAYVHPTAVLIGDVIVGPRCYVGPGASLRGDFGALVLEEGSNLQDTCVMHSFPAAETVVETNGHIGHGAVLHGCRIGKNAMIGMNAIIMDGAVIGESSIVGALTFVKAGMVVPARSLVVGIPGVVTRELTEQEIGWKADGTAVYQSLTERCMRTMREVQPLTGVTADRKRIADLATLPAYTTKDQSR